MIFIFIYFIFLRDNSEGLEDGCPRPLVGGWYFISWVFYFLGQISALVIMINGCPSTTLYGFDFDLMWKLHVDITLMKTRMMVFDCLRIFCMIFFTNL